MEPKPATGCTWPGTDPLMIRYHDEEWGVPLYDERKIFEFMVLDAFQAGLSWRTVLHKRTNFERAFAGFEPEKVARFTDKKLQALSEDAGIIRNRLKIAATVSNAKCFLAVQKEYGTFSDYIWQFVDHRPILNKWKVSAEIPAKSRESDAMSRDLQMRGFKFVGSTICYAFMQAAGMVNDHLLSCPRHRQVQQLVKK